MLPMILFLVGILLFYTRRFSFGSLRTEGRHVKAAGAVLMAPMGISFGLGIVVGLIVGPDYSTLLTVMGVLMVVELLCVVGAVVTAYILIVDPQNAPQLPGILGQIQRARRDQPAQPTPVVPVPTRQTFPSVMSVAEAASYLHVTEADIVDLIDGGKLAAARINYQYRIAKSNLDDILNQRAQV